MKTLSCVTYGYIYIYRAYTPRHYLRIIYAEISRLTSYDTVRALLSSTCGATQAPRYRRIPSFPLVCNDTVVGGVTAEPTGHLPGKLSSRSGRQGQKSGTEHMQQYRRCFTITSESES